MNSHSQLRMLVFASLMAALMTAGAYISIPVGPVPIVLQNMFVFLYPDYFYFNKVLQIIY